METNRADGGWCPEEAPAIVGFWGERGITVRWRSHPSTDRFFDCTFTKAQELGIHCTLDTCALLLSGIHLKIRPLDGGDRLVPRKSPMNGTKLWPAIPIKTILACAKYFVRYWKLSDSPRFAPGLTDRDDLIEFENCAKTPENVDKFEISPYHTMGNGVSWVFTNWWVWNQWTKKNGSKMRRIWWKLAFKHYLERVKGIEENSWQSQRFF